MVPRVFPKGLLIVPALLIIDGAFACGWWGDGEMNRDHQMDYLVAGKAHVPELLDSESMKFPANLGYGMAILEPGLALPYLHATFGKPITSIGNFSAYGIRTVIDLNPDARPATRQLHEVSSRGMRYHHLPVQGAIPDLTQVAELRELILDSNNLPIVITASSAELLAGTWATYRLTFGAPFSYVVAETVVMGLLPEQESILRKQFRHESTRAIP